MRPVSAITGPSGHLFTNQVVLFYKLSLSGENWHSSFLAESVKVSSKSIQHFRISPRPKKRQ